MVKPVESTTDGGADVRLSRKLSHVFEKASAALDFIYFNGDLEDDDVIGFNQFYWPLEETLFFSVMEGGATKGLLEAISAMDKLWRTSTTDKPELILKLRQNLIAIENLALLLAKRNRRELPFSRQMDKLMHLVVREEYLSEELVNSFDLVTQRGDFDDHQRKLLRKVLAERENLFRAFEQEGLARYEEAFRELALALGLDEDTIGDLETELFVDLEWFHPA